MPVKPRAIPVGVGMDIIAMSMGVLVTGVFLRPAIQGGGLFNPARKTQEIPDSQQNQHHRNGQLQ